MRRTLENWRKRYARMLLPVLLFLCALCFGSVQANAATPYQSNGQLSVSKNKIVNEKGKAFVIKGVSTHGLAWFPDYVNKKAFKNLRDQWGVNTIRLALYTAEYNGYCTGGNQKELKQLIDNGVTYATELGMYVIIDWHILSDGNPLTYKSQSAVFFKEVAKKYAGYGNVMYEICNEPNGGSGSWSNIKSYAKTIIKKIRSVNPDAIIIVGTPTWSQDVDVAVKSRITGYQNIAYAFHFYAGTHQDSYRNKLKSALDDGLPVIVTEFGLTDASGNGEVNQKQGDKWFELLDSYKVGRICWSLSNKNESCSLIKSSCSKKYDWQYADLSTQGKWLVSAYKGKLAKTTATPTPTPKPSAAPKVTPTPTPAAAQKTTKGKTAVSDGTVKLKTTIKRVSSWKSNGKYYTQYKVVIKNTGKQTSSKWSVVVDFNRKPVCSSKWNAVFSRKSNKLTLKPVAWNTQIAGGESIEIGFILESSKAQSVKEISITAS